MDAAEREEKASDALTEEFAFQALGSLAHFDRVMYDGKDFGQLAMPGTPEEEEFLGIPGLLEPEPVPEVLMSRVSRQARHRSAPEAHEAEASATSSDAPDSPPPTHPHRPTRPQAQLPTSPRGTPQPTTAEA